MNNHNKQTTVDNCIININIRQRYNITSRTMNTNNRFNVSFVDWDDISIVTFLLSFC